MVGPSDQEQLFLELINEARLDPMGNAARYLTAYAPLKSNDPDIQAAIDYFKVSGSDLLSAYKALNPVAPLAWNGSLATAAEKHSSEMIAADQQSHQVPGEAGLGERIKAEGYNFIRAGENVYAYASNVMYGHAGFMIDWGIGPGGMQSPAGHRVNIMSANFSEVGIDVSAERDIATEVGSLIVTQDFGDRNLAFVTGVAYSDRDRNAFYSLGEGRNDLKIEIGGDSTTTGTSGGYSLAIGTGLKTITLSGGGLTGTVTVKTTIAADNIKLDVVDGDTLLTSGSIEVSGSISIIRGIGTLNGGLTLTAGAGNQLLVGTTGNDILNGGDGNDRFSGGAGDERIDGGAGIDVAIYQSDHSKYSVSAASNGQLIITGTDSGTDTLTATEIFRFADGDWVWSASQRKLTSKSNAAPVTQPTQSVTTIQDTTKQITVSATDADGDTLIYMAGAASHGTVTGGTGGIFTYNPQAGFYGSDSFMVTITDGNGASTSQTVSLNIQAADATTTGANSAPVADAILRISADEDVPRQLKIFATDADGDTLTYSVVKGFEPKHGTLTGGERGLFLYTPAPGYSGLEGFQIEISDGRGGTTKQVIELWVYGTNDAPVVTSTQATSTKPDTAKTILVQATDPEGDRMTYTASKPANGSVSGGADGSFVYKPNASFTGTDVFNVTVSDGKGGSSIQTVTVNVTNAAVNTAPTATPTQAVTTNEDATKEVKVIATDPDGDALSYTASAAAHGTVTGGAGGVFTYTPTTNYNGSDSFVVTASDGKGGKITQTVNVTVVPQNDAPTAQATQSLATAKDTTKTFTVGATDVDGDTLTYTPGSAAHGSITNNGNGSFTFTPTAGYTGTDMFYVAVSDGKGGSISQKINVTVSAGPNNNPPTDLVVPKSFRLFTGEGFVGQVDGGGTVYGSEGFQKIILGDKASAVTLDGSFNQGGDVIRIVGQAIDFTAKRDGGSVILVDGNRTYTIPFGDVGVSLVFDDGVRKLVMSEGVLKIGAMPIDGLPTILDIPSDNTPVPTGENPNAIGRAFMSDDGNMTVGGRFQVFGTEKSQDITYVNGNLVLDGSFNQGGDTLHLLQDPSAYKAYMSGMSLILTSADGQVTIPVGDVGMVLDFNGLERTLRFDTVAGITKIGDISITAKDAASAITLGSGGGSGGATTELDGLGNPNSDLGAAVIDAGTGAKTFHEGAGPTNVLIRNFGEDDLIILTDVSQISRYFFTTGTGANNHDLIINHTTASGVASMIVLDEVLNSTDVYSYATARDSIGFDFISLG